VNDDMGEVSRTMFQQAAQAVLRIGRAIGLEVQDRQPVIRDIEKVLNDELAVDAGLQGLPVIEGQFGHGPSHIDEQNPLSAFRPEGLGQAPGNELSRDAVGKRDDGDDPVGNGLGRGDEGSGGNALEEPRVEASSKFWSY
jgi:hypothetical protein